MNKNLLPEVKFGRLWTPISRIWSRHWSNVSSMYHNHSAILGYASTSGSCARALSQRSLSKKVLSRTPRLRSCSVPYNYVVHNNETLIELSIDSMSIVPKMRSYIQVRCQAMRSLVKAGSACCHWSLAFRSPAHFQVSYSKALPNINIQVAFLYNRVLRIRYSNESYSFRY